MKLRRDQAFRALVAEVNDVLYDEWAPIGFAGALPRDEYVTYATHVVSLLAAGGNEEEIGNYLESVAAGFNVGFEAPSRKVAADLMQFQEKCRALAP